MNYLSCLLLCVCLVVSEINAISILKSDQQGKKKQVALLRELSNCDDSKTLVAFSENLKLDAISKGKVVVNGNVILKKNLSVKQGTHKIVNVELDTTTLRKSFPGIDGYYWKVKMDVTGPDNERLFCIRGGAEIIALKN